MKHITIITLVILLLAGSGFAGPDLVLDETFGLTEKVLVLDYNKKEKKVKVRVNDAIETRPFDSLTPVAQDEILAWVADENFESSSGLRVRIKEKSKDIETDHGEVEHVVYLVEFENRGDVALDQIRVQSMVFYEKHKDETEQKCRAIKSARITIPSGKKHIFKSNEVSIHDEIIKHESRTNSNGDERSRPSEYIEDELNGLVLILTRVSRNGQPVVREFKKGRPPKPEDRPDYR